MKGDDLAERYLEFGVRVIRLVAALPKSTAAKHVGMQLLRSGTSCGANYEEARGAESRQDFIHKVSICWKETRESWYWLKLIHRAQLISPKRIEGLMQEGKELTLIASKTLFTARANKK